MTFFTLISIFVLLARINAQDDNVASVTESLPASPVTGASIIQIPNRRESPCGAGQRRDANGKCRKVW